MKKITTLWWVFFVELALFMLIIGGIVPRDFAWALAVLLVGYSLFAKLEDVVVLFVMSIPFFIALPITATFDNFNTWRPVSFIIFGRWFWKSRRELTQYLWPLRWIAALILVALLSLINAQHQMTGIVRIIYFINLSLVPLVIWALIRQKIITSERIIHSIAIPTIIVIVVGFIQLFSTYLFDVYQFMRIWGEGIQLRQFGEQWSYIAVHVGNTWLAYYGNQLSLRVFSLFPDSHSFPTFILLGIPALLATANSSFAKLRWPFIWIPLAYLAAILSGTRGIWAAAVGVVVLIVPFVFWLIRCKRISVGQNSVFKFTSSTLIIFFLLFFIAWPIFISPQFLIGKGDWGMFAGRIRSVIDFGETSNAIRLAIWKSSLISISHNPLLGIGIGNFPVVLNQDIQLARAGSTAHNLYIHIATEMGIPAALGVIVLLIATFTSVWRWFTKSAGESLSYTSGLLLTFPWICAYVMTDPIIFDERVFLMFTTTIALVWAERHD